MIEGSESVFVSLTNGSGSTKPALSMFFSFLVVPVFGIRIHMFLGLQDPDPLVRGYGSGSGSFYHQAKIVKKNLDSYCFVTFFLDFYIFER
jgi:hypothetical protein